MMAKPNRLGRHRKQEAVMKAIGTLVAATLAIGAMSAALAVSAHPQQSNEEKDKEILANLDTEYQAAVKVNDVATMDRLLADNFTLVTGSGRIYSKKDLLDEARSGRITYEHQEDTDKTVRIWGDTAVVTAKLWEKGTEDGKPFDHTAWFSDTYIRTPTRWIYVFAQSSLSLPKAGLNNTSGREAFDARVPAAYF
jgi:ketosteroid isomerase-like protein